MQAWPPLCRLLMSRECAAKCSQRRRFDYLSSCLRRLKPATLITTAYMFTCHAEILEVISAAP